jgi:Holliday junction DNA helicase RuvA
MIDYLKGQYVETRKSLNNRVVLILETQQIGYEIQIPSRYARALTTDNDTPIQVFVHQQIREDQIILYGFASAAERDLFRHLTSVSGIGSQGAIALIDTLGLETLVQAIVTGNIRTLIKAPGIGKKTAERLALELRTKLAQWRQQVGGKSTTTTATPALAVLEDVEMTLLALGYESEEIEQAISALSSDAQLLKNPNPEEWIRNAIAWLSQ